MVINSEERNITKKQLLCILEDYTVPIFNAISATNCEYIANDILKAMNDLLTRPAVKIKIKGDAGEYDIWAIDWLNLKVLVNRTTVNQWIDFNKCKILNEVR